MSESASHIQCEMMQAKRQDSKKIEGYQLQTALLSLKSLNNLNSSLHFSAATTLQLLKLIPILLSKSLGSLQAFCCFGTAWTNCIKLPWSLSEFPWHIWWYHQILNTTCLRCCKLHSTWIHLNSSCSFCSSVWKHLSCPPPFPRPGEKLGAS